MLEPVRVFAGCSPDGLDAEAAAVFHFSLSRHCSRPIDLHWMILSRDPSSPFSGWQTDRWPTPFSAFRWAVPWLCDFRGRAIYSDVDVIFRRDIAELWDMPIASDKAIIAKDHGRLCVSLWNCERAKDFVLPIERLRDVSGHSAMRAVMSANRHRIQSFGETDWNCLDLEGRQLDDPKIGAIHFTSMDHQLHIPRAQARLAARGSRHWFDGVWREHWRKELVTLFEQELSDAERAGFKVANYDPGEIFGALNKAKLTSLIGATPHWGKGA